MGGRVVVLGKVNVVFVEFFEGRTCRGSLAVHGSLFWVFGNDRVTGLTGVFGLWF